MPEEPATLPFRLRQEFLSPAETAFYHVLHEMVKDHLYICPRIHLHDLFFVTRPNENVHQFNKINRKTIDFLLIYRDTLKPALAIELDYPKQNEVRETDEFLENLFKAANLPFVHVVVQQTYDVQGLAKKFRDAMKKAKSADPFDNEAAYSPICPRCGITMVLRFSREDGPFRGQKYYGCLNFPSCTAVVPVGEPT